jgi:hypothetical protein
MMLFLENHILSFILSLPETQTRGSSNNGGVFAIIDSFAKEAKYILIV